MSGLLSIITINYNNKEGLIRTIESIKSQKSREFEYIVIDGGSTDGSVDVLKENGQFIDYWVSEPDSGIYNAMNKGVKASRGTFCQFLNSGDWLFSDKVIEEIIPILKDKESQYDILVGYTNQIDAGGKPSRMNEGTPKQITLHHMLCSYISHPSSFTKRELLEKIPFDETLKIVSDWKFFIDAYLDNAKFGHINKDVTIYDTTGISTTMSEKVKKEREIICNHIVHPELMTEISTLPSEIVYYYGLIPNSVRLRKLLLRIFKSIIQLYAIFKGGCKLKFPVDL